MTFEAKPSDAVNCVGSVIKRNVHIHRNHIVQYRLLSVCMNQAGRKELRVFVTASASYRRYSFTRTAAQSADRPSSRGVREST